MNQSSGSSSGGLIHHAHLFSDDTSETKALKPRRPTLSLKHSDFLSSLVPVEVGKEERQRWFFSGVLNGWPGLGYNCPLEVISITYKPKKNITTALKKGKTVLRWWDSSKNKNKSSSAPTIPPADLLYDK